MTDIGFSSSAAGTVAVQASGAAKPQTPQIDAAAAQNNAAAARNIADSVVLSSGALQKATAVSPADRSQQSNTKAVGQGNQDQAQQSSAAKAQKSAGPDADRQQLSQRIEQALGSITGDVNTLMRIFGLNSEESAEVQKKFSHKIAEKVGEPPEASIGMRAAVPYYHGPLSLEVRDIQVNIQTLPSGERDFSVDFGSIAVNTPDQAAANTYAGRPTHIYTTPEGLNVSVQPDSNGVIIDTNGEGTREVASVLTGSTRSVAGQQTDAGQAEQAAIEGRQRPGFDPQAEAAGTDVARDRFGAAESADRNKDGTADQQDAGFESLLVVRSGTASPTAEAGFVRVQFDSVMPMNERYDNATLLAAQEATAPAPNRVVEPSADGYDVNV